MTEQKQNRIITCLFNISATSWKIFGDQSAMTFNESIRSISFFCIIRCCKTSRLRNVTATAIAIITPFSTRYFQFQCWTDGHYLLSTVLCSAWKSWLTVKGLAKLVKFSLLDGGPRVKTPQVVSTTSRRIYSKSKQPKRRGEYMAMRCIKLVSRFLLLKLAPTESERVRLDRCKATYIFIAKFFKLKTIEKFVLTHGSRFIIAEEWVWNIWWSNFNIIKHC